MLSKDTDGVVRAVYSWRLVETDRVPAGKKDKGAFRDLEEAINLKLEVNISVAKGKCTVIELVEKYIRQKAGVKKTTRLGYRTVLRFLNKDPFDKRRIDEVDKRRIDEVKLSDAKEWLIKLQQEDKKSYSTIHTIRGVLRPAFQMAVDDDLLLKNPFQFEMVTVLVNDSVMREAISRKDERRFLEFIKNDKHY